MQVKKNMLRWVNKHTKKTVPLGINNLDIDLADGRVFITIMNRVDPTGPQLEASEARSCTQPQMRPELSEHTDATYILHDTFISVIIASYDALFAQTTPKHTYILHDSYQDPLDNVARAFRLAENKYGVPLIMDIEDPLFWKDDKTVVPQLNEMMTRACQGNDSRVT